MLFSFLSNVPVDNTVFFHETACNTMHCISVAFIRLSNMCLVTKLNDVLGIF